MGRFSQLVEYFYILHDFAVELVLHLFLDSLHQEVPNSLRHTVTHVSHYNSEVSVYPSSQFKNKCSVTVDRLVLVLILYFR